MMKSCLDTIVLLNDASEIDHHSVEDQVATESFILIFQCNGKYSFDINSMIDCSFIQDYQRHYTLGTASQPNHYFLWEYSSLLKATFCIGISKICCPHPIILRVIDTRQCERTFSFEKRILMVSSFRKSFWNSAFKFFPDLILWSSESSAFDYCFTGTWL